MAGRTSWWPCDAAEHDRELHVELGEEFGPGGPLTMRVLKDLAQQQRTDEGEVRTGFRSLRQKTHVESPAKVREIVEKAAEIGAIDDLEIDADGRRFTCRVSGWRADQDRGRASIRKADQRAKDAELSRQNVTSPGVVTPERDVSRSVPLPDHNQTNNNTACGAVKFAGKIVPAAVFQRAEQVLADFNDRAATSYRPLTAAGKPTEQFKRILGALIDHPDLDTAQALRVNEVGLDSPFWEGPAQPGNVWGPGVVDRNIQKAAGSTHAELMRVALK